MRKVQYREDVTAEWNDCVREDLIDFLQDDTTPPPALFYTLIEAEEFITFCLGIMHCGGRRSDFRVVETWAK